MSQHGTEATTSASDRTGVPAQGPAKPKRAKRRKWPWVTLGCIVLLVFLAWVGLNCFAASWIANNGHIRKAEPNVAAIGYPAREVSYGKGLVAWYTPPRHGKPVVVIVHGFQANRAHVLATARALYPLGYGLLLPDLGYVSGKTTYGGGDREASQVIMAVNFAHVHSHAKVALIGYSEGGAEAILAADRNARVVAVISDSAPVSFLSIATQRAGIPQWVLAGTYVVYPWFGNGANLEDLSSVLPGTYHVPTLVIQGTKDTTVPYSNGPTLATLTHGTLWTVSGAGHDQALLMNPALYTQRVTSFIQSAVAAHR